MDLPQCKFHSQSVASLSPAAKMAPGRGARQHSVVSLASMVSPAAADWRRPFAAPPKKQLSERLLGVDAVGGYEPMGDAKKGYTSYNRAVVAVAIRVDIPLRHKIRTVAVNTRKGYGREDIPLSLRGPNGREIWQIQVTLKQSEGGLVSNKDQFDRFDLGHAYFSKVPL